MLCSSLITIRDLLRSSAAADQTLDSALFYEPLGKVFLQPQCPALLAGGIASLLYGDARLSEPDVFKLLTGSLNAASAQAGDQTAFLIGLLGDSDREIAQTAQESLAALPGAQVDAAVMAMLAGTAAVYTLGVLQLVLIGKLSVGKAATVGVLPFLPGDVLKIAAASVITMKVKDKIKI